MGERSFRASSGSRLAHIVGFVGLASACSAGAGPTWEATGTGVEPILNGTPATSYPEAALIDMTQQGSPYEGSCSGSLIAPQVVLTAGHCVKGEMGAMTLIPDTWAVTLPYNGRQRFTSTSAATYDWPTTDGTVDPSTHDIGLVFLDKPANVTPDQCPALATTKLSASTQVINIGRVQNGNVSTSGLYVGAPITVSNSQQFPFDYESTDVIEQGDSGGPDEVPSSMPHLIVAVNSGAGMSGFGASTQVLARVDLLSDWITQQIMSHGGPCIVAGDAGGSGGSSGGGSGGTSGSSSGGSSGGGSGGTSGSSSGGTGGSSGGGSASGGSSGGGSGGSSGSGTSADDGGITVNDAGAAPAGDGAVDGAWNTTSTTGCGCRTAGTEGSTHAVLAFGALAAIGFGRRSRRRAPTGSA